MTKTADDLKARLEKARAERKALEAAAQPTEEALLADELAREELALANAKALAEAVEKHGPVGVKVAVVDTALGAVIVKRPNHLHFRRFIDAEKVNSETLDQLVRSCVVHPAGPAFNHILEELPATLNRCGDAVVALAGFKAKEVSGKS